MKPQLVSIPPSPALVSWSEKKLPSSSSPPPFTDYLNTAIRGIDALQRQADTAAIGVVTGEIEDVHQAVIAAEKASLSMQLGLQVRNKVLEAYQEIIRMPV